MTTRRAGAVMVVAVAAWLAVSGPGVQAADQGQQAGATAAAAPARPYVPPRTPDGQPDISGMYNGNPNGTYNIQDLEYQSLFQNNRPNLEMRGKSRVIDPADGKIPYQPWAAEKRNLIHDNHADPTPQFLDPSARCFLQGVPRHLYNREMEIFQAPGYVVFFNMAHHTYRAIRLDGAPHIPERVKLFMGDSRGRWEGNTLIVNVPNNNDQTWFDIVGDFHSDALQVVERFTIVDRNTIDYQAVLTDPKVYTRPWTMGLKLVRDTASEKAGNELWEEACYENNWNSLEGMLNRPGRGNNGGR